MTKCGTEELSDYDAATAIRIRISLYKVQQEILYDTISDPMHYATVIPTIVDELQVTCAAIESLENMRLKSMLGTWYNDIREQFFTNENVQSFVYNQVYGKMKEENQVS